MAEKILREVYKRPCNAEELTISPLSNVYAMLIRQSCIQCRFRSKENKTFFSFFHHCPAFLRHFYLFVFVISLCNPVYTVTENVTLWTQQLAVTLGRGQTAFPANNFDHVYGKMPLIFTYLKLVPALLWFSCIRKKKTTFLNNVKMHSKFGAFFTWHCLSKYHFFKCLQDWWPQFVALLASFLPLW